MLNGQKAFISNAGYRHELRRDAPGPDRGGADGATFGSFIVTRGAQGYTLGPKLRGIGWKGLDTRDLFFDNVWVPDTRSWASPAAAWRSSSARLKWARISIAALSLGTAAGAHADGPGLRAPA